MRENLGIQQFITIVIKYLLIIRVQRLPKNRQAYAIESGALPCDRVPNASLSLVFILKKVHLHLIRLLGHFKLQHMRSERAY